MKPTALDHIALYVPERDALAAFWCDALDVHVIDRSDRYTLVGAAATSGKLTLFGSPTAERPASSRIVSIMMYDPSGSPRDPLVSDGGPMLTFGTHELVPAGTPRHSVIGLTLRSLDPPITAAEYCDLFGFAHVASHRDVARVGAGGGVLTLVRERPRKVAQPMLNHLGLLVDSAQQHIDEAGKLGMGAVDVIDAPNTLAVFVDGPEHVRLEYVEHKPEFALA